MLYLVCIFLLQSNKQINVILMFFLSILNVIHHTDMKKTRLNKHFHLECVPHL